jgi:hypothetical protein
MSFAIGIAGLIGGVFFLKKVADRWMQKEQQYRFWREQQREQREREIAAEIAAQSNQTEFEFVGRFVTR